MREEELKAFTITDKFFGYRNKTDVVQEDRGIAVSGSQNCIIIDGKLGIRPGFEYVGGRSTDRYGIQGGGSWKMSNGEQIMWRGFDNGSNACIEILNGTTWETLTEALTTGYAAFRTITFWDTTNIQDILILVNGTANIYSWSGGLTTYASAAANTITKEGTTTWAEERFLTGTKSIRMKDDSGTWREYQYTGGEDTTILTGVTPDPTSSSFTAGALCVQKIDTSSNQPSSVAKNDFVINYLNHLFVFSLTNRIVLMSKLNDFDDFSAQSSPRLPAEAGTFTLDEEPTAAAVAPVGSSLYINTKNYYYQFTFVDSDDGTAQTIKIDPTYIPFGGATNPLAIGNIKNYITMITGEPTFDTLGNVINTEGVRNESLSDDTKNYFDSAVVDEAANAYYKNNSYLSVKSSSDFGSNNNILIRNLQQNYWETPWTIPSTTIFEHEGSLYASDPALKNTFKLLTGYCDGQNGDIAGAPISGKFYSAFDDFGLLFNQKEFDTVWVEGYITPNTELDFIFTYGFDGETQKATLKGTDTDDGVVLTTSGGGIGYYSLGTRSLGGRGETLEFTGLQRFRGFITLPVKSFYEMQYSIQSNQVNARWEVTGIGFNVRKVLSQDNNLKI